MATAAEVNKIYLIKNSEALDVGMANLREKTNAARKQLNDDPTDPVRAAEFQRTHGAEMLYRALQATVTKSDRDIVMGIIQKMGS